MGGVSVGVGVKVGVGVEGKVGVRFGPQIPLPVSGKIEQLLLVH